MLLTSLILSVVLVLSVLRDFRGARAIGRIVLRDRPGRRRRMLAVVGIIVVAGLVMFADTEVPRALSLLVLLQSAMLVALTPGLGDSALGEDGVRSGWDACRFEHFEEWRLTGDHLRWKLFGEWQACEVPPAVCVELRTRLEQVVGERESRFRA